MSEFGTRSRRAIELVRDGMEVFDATGANLGKVEYVDLGDPQSTTAGGEELHDVFRYGAAAINDRAGEPQVSEPLRTRMIRSGFVKIDGSGLFDSDLYASADQISRVDGGRVVLSVPKDGLAAEE